MNLGDTFLKHFSITEDPRIKNHNFRHLLSDILIIAILGTICGADGWVEIERFAHAEVTRTTHHKVERSTRYFITSLEYEEIDSFMEAVRKHWNIEIDLHWSLDVSFREDHGQVHIGHAAENLALIRRIALNLLKQEKTHKNGITCRRKTAGWDHQYLLKVLKADRQLV